MRLRAKSWQKSHNLLVVSRYKEILWEHDEHEQSCHLLAPGVEEKDRKITNCSKADDHHDLVKKAASTVGKSQLQSLLAFLLPKIRVHTFWISYWSKDMSPQLRILLGMNFQFLVTCVIACISKR